MRLFDHSIAFHQKLKPFRFILLCAGFIALRPLTFQAGPPFETDDPVPTEWDHGEFVLVAP
jgi:hypothetical protein